MAKSSLYDEFLFHPSDVEVITYYLKRKIMGRPLPAEAIPEVEIYKFAPWDLPAKCSSGSIDRGWYFFVARERKNTSRTRTKRTTDIGNWKAGNERAISDENGKVGWKRNLVFHLGKGKTESKTNWQMNEFRLDVPESAMDGFPQDTFVVCRVFLKSNQGRKSMTKHAVPGTVVEHDITKNDPGGSSSCVPSQSGLLKFDQSSMTSSYLCEATVTSSFPEVGDTSLESGLSSELCTSSSKQGERSKTSPLRQVNNENEADIELDYDLLAALPIPDLEDFPSVDAFLQEFSFDDSALNTESNSIINNTHKSSTEGSNSIITNTSSGSGPVQNVSNVFLPEPGIELGDIIGYNESQYQGQ